MDFAEFADWALKAIVGGAAALVVLEMRRVRDSIEALNINIAVVITKTDNHEKRITKLEGE